MEDALAPLKAAISLSLTMVLILVLMEDALAQGEQFPPFAEVEQGLNPCFNGRCTRTFYIITILYMETISLNPCFNGRCTRTLLKDYFAALKDKGLNPCFNGRCTRTKLQNCRG